MGYLASIMFVISAIWPLHVCRAEGDPPSQLTGLATLLRAAGGIADIKQIDRDEWELTVDFPSKIGDDVLMPLHDIRGLTSIRILNGGVTDKGLAHLKNLPDLRLLVVNSREITDEGLVAVGALKGLSKLDIIQPRLTGRGLVALAPLVNLKELYLYGADIRDEDVEPLKQMGHLDWLHLPGSVTNAQCEQLKLALSTTHVTRDEQTDAPAGNPPDVLIASDIDADGNLVLVDYETIVIQPAPPLSPGGQRINRILSEVPLEGASISDVAGNAVTVEEARKRMEGKDTAILVLSDGVSLLPIYRRLFRDDALVFVFPGKAPTWKKI